MQEGKPHTNSGSAWQTARSSGEMTRSASGRGWDIVQMLPEEPSGSIFLSLLEPQLQGRHWARIQGFSSVQSLICVRLFETP